MKKLFGICLCIFILSIMSMAYAQGFEMELTSENYGNIFTTEEQAFQLNIKNTSGSDFSGVVKYTALYEGEKISLSEKSVKVASNGTYTDLPVFSCTKYGIYELQATLTNDSGDEYTTTTPFSYINASGEGEVNDNFLVNTHISVYNNGEEVVKAIKNAGFGGIRDTLYWFEAETETKGNYAMPDYTAYTINTVTEEGMEPLVVLSAGNGLWEVENGVNLNIAPSTDEQIKAFANYCGYIAEQSKGKVKYYEIWNEFNQEGSNSGDTSGAAYAKLLAAASEAIKAKDSNAKIVAMCTSQIDRNFIKAADSALSSMGKSNCYDVVSVHPYDLSGSYRESNYKRNISLLKSITNKPIWFTEKGWNTSTEDSGVSERNQAVYTILDYLVALENDMCERIYYYDFQDDGTNAAEAEHNWGFIKAHSAEVPGEAKPAYVALAAMNKLIGQSDYESTSWANNVRACKFKDESGKYTYVLHGAVGRYTGVSTNLKSVEILDMYSNVVDTMSAEDGVYHFNMSDEIMYLRETEKPAGCEISLNNGELQVNGYSVAANQEVSVLVTSIDGSFIYAGQITSDKNRAYNAIADTQGFNEIYITVNYGDVYNTEIETGFVIKLMCDGKRILSLDEITSDNVELVVSVNEEVKTGVDVFAAVYNANRFVNTNKIRLESGTKTGDYSVKIELGDVSTFDKISGFIWQDMKPVIGNVDFK